MRINSTERIADNHIPRPQFIRSRTPETPVDIVIAASLFYLMDQGRLSGSWHLRPIRATIRRLRREEAPVLAKAARR